MNSSESQPINPNSAQAEAVQIRSSRRFRWCTIPAALSGFFGFLALSAIPIGIVQNIEVYQDPSNRMIFSATLAMPVALLVSGILNVFAGLRWFRAQWLTALMCNATAYVTMLIPITMFESAMDTAKSLP